MSRPTASEPLCSFRRMSSSPSLPFAGGRHALRGQRPWRGFKTLWLGSSKDWNWSIGLGLSTSRSNIKRWCSVDCLGLCNRWCRRRLGRVGHSSALSTCLLLRIFWGRLCPSRSWCAGWRNSSPVAQPTIGLFRSQTTTP